MRFKLSSSLFLRSLSVFGWSALIVAGSGSSAQAQTDTSPPAVDLTVPGVNLHYAAASFPGFSGTASDAQSGVSKVEVTLFRDWNGNREYWNWLTSGTGAWGTVVYTRQATLSNGNWTLNSNLPGGNFLENGRYTTIVAATNGANLKTTLASRNFFIGNDTAAPTATVDTPAPGAILSSLTAVNGTITDTGDSGLALGSVYARLTKVATGTTYYWTGSAWSATDPQLPVNLGPLSNGTRTWTLNANFPTSAQTPTGQYRVTIVGNDQARNSLTYGQDFGITPNDTEAPQVTLTYPTNGLSISRLGRITGTADDVSTKANEGPSGVARVDVQLRRTVTVGGNSQNQYWDAATGNWTTTATTYLPNRLETSWIRNTGLPTSANFPYGTYNISVRAIDYYNNLTSLATTSFTYTANHLPVASNQTLTTPSGTPIEFDLSALDQDSDDLTYTIVTGPSHGTLDPAGGSGKHRTYTPDAGWSGNDTITFTASDPDGTSNTCTITITTLQPVVFDASISQSSDASTIWTGQGSNNAPEIDQTISQTINAGTSTTYWVALSKSGGAGSESAKITMVHPDVFTTGWDVHFYEGATGNTEISSQVIGSGYPVTVTGTKTVVLRFVVTAPAGAATDDVGAVLVKVAQVTSSEAVVSDTVQALTDILAIAQPDLVVTPCDAAGNPLGTSIGDGQYYPQTTQALRNDLIAGETHYFRVKVKNTNARAAIFNLSIPASPTNWTTTILNINGDLLTTGTTWTTPAIVGGDSYEQIVKVWTVPIEHWMGGANQYIRYLMAIRAINGALQDQVDVSVTMHSAPDARIRHDVPDAEWAGAGIYNLDATNQTVTVYGYPGINNFFEFDATLHNEADDMQIVGSTLHTPWFVEFTDGATNLKPHFRVFVPPSASPGESKEIPIHVKSFTADGTLYGEDVIKAVIIVRQSVQPDLSFFALPLDGGFSDSDTHFDPTEPSLSWVGSAVMNADATNQSHTSATIAGLTRRFVVQVKNTGDTSCRFILTLPIPPEGWTVRLYDKLDTSTRTNITLDARTGWPTPLIEARGSIYLLLEIAPGLASTKNYDALLTARSGNLIDTIAVHQKLQRVTGIEWSDGSGNEEDWQSLPTTGGLTVKQDHLLGFRVLVEDPTISWVDLGGFHPSWLVEPNTSNGDYTYRHNGSPLYVHFPFLGNYTITPDAGQQPINVQVLSANTP